MSDLPFGWPRIHFAAVSSTMPVLADLAHLGARHGTVVTTDYQSAGTGRDGRPWVAAAGSSLLMSVLIRTSRTANDTPILSLLVASAVADTVEAFGVDDVSIKWPNDVLVRGRKISGILLRSRPVRTGSAMNVVVGIGLNLTAEVAGNPNAANLVAESDLPIARSEVRDRLLRRIGELAKRFESSNHHDMLGAISAKLAFRGELVDVNSGKATVKGVVSRLRDDGALMIELGDGQQVAIVSGELQRGPRLVEPIQ